MNLLCFFPLARVGRDSPTALLRENFLKESLKSTCNSHPLYHRQENGQEENEIKLMAVRRGFAGGVQKEMQV
jgi:hypothetical protein